MNVTGRWPCFGSIPTVDLLRDDPRFDALVRKVDC